MFGRKKPRAKPMVQCARITGAQGVLFEGAITALDIPEALTIELSIEFFDDPEPCQIHRSAVARRVFMELSEVLGEESVTRGDDLPEVARRYLAAYPAIQEVRLYRREADA